MRMNCHYHDTIEATTNCIQCKKALCNECHHTDYPDYCWSCGLDHDNRLEEAEKSFQFPTQLENKYVFYFLHKLSSAFGASVIFTLLLFILFALFGANEMISIAIVVWILTATIVFTYGIIVSMVLDLLARFMSWMRLWHVQMGLYLVLGLLFPYVIETDIGFSQVSNSYNGGIIALLFFGMQKTRLSKNKIIFTGLVSLLFISIMLLVTFINLISN